MPAHWHGDPEWKYRPAPPVEWTCHVLASNYNVTPYQAWLDLGYPALPPRQRHRLTLAAAGLGSLSAAMDDVGRKRGPKDAPADYGHTLMAKEAVALYEAAELPERELFNAAVEAGAERRAKLGLTDDDPPLSRDEIDELIG